MAPAGWSCCVVAFSVVGFVGAEESGCRCLTPSVVMVVGMGVEVRR
jgi:hypothetical protein